MRPRFRRWRRVKGAVLAALCVATGATCTAAATTVKVWEWALVQHRRRPRRRGASAVWDMPGKWEPPLLERVVRHQADIRQLLLSAVPLCVRSGRAENQGRIRAEVRVEFLPEEPRPGKHRSVRSLLLRASAVPTATTTGASACAWATCEYGLYHMIFSESYINDSRRS